jgi:predicted PurR-regulated permease PerM
MDQVARRKRIVRITLLSLLGVGALVFMAALDNVFGPLIFALLLAYILNPVVNWIQRWRVARAPAIGILFLAFYACLAGFFLMTIPALATQVGNLYDATIGERAAATMADLTDFATPDEIREIVPPWQGWVRFHVDEDGDGKYQPGYARKLAAWVQRLKERFGRTAKSETFREGVEALRKRLLGSSTVALDTAVRTLLDAVYTFFGFLTAFVLVPIYLFYFLLGLSSIRDRTFELLPGRHRERIVTVLTRIDEAVSAFFRGRLIIMLIKGLITTVALWICGVPFSLLIGFVTGVGSLIPIAGFMMGMIPGVAIAFLDSGSFGLAGVVATIFVVIEVFENYLLGPWILRDRVGLHPITLIVSVFVGGALFGFVGMLLAVPVGAVVKILFLEFVLPEIQALAAEEPEG